ncbi:hypothetical protein BH10PAT1_BH10PAT1_1070 [soil metagenome]
MSHTIDQCFSIDYVNKRVYNPGSYNDVFTTRALYSYLQDTFDELVQLDDTIPMSAQTPTDFTLINGWFIDDTSIQYLKGGAITTTGYNTEVYILYFQAGGYTSAISGDIGKTVTDGSTHIGKLLSYNNTLKKWWVRKSSGTFANSDVLTITTGTGAGTVLGSSGVLTGENIYPNIYTLGSIDETNSSYAQQIYIIQNKTHLTEWWPDPNGTTRQIDVLIKTQEAGTPVDSGNLTIFLRHYPTSGTAGGDVVDLYDNFGLSAVLSGRNAVPLATAADLNNTASQATVSGYNDINIVFVNGTITHGAITGTFTALESISQATSGATGVFISESSGTMTVGNVTGTFDNSHVITGGSSGATTTATGTFTTNNTTRVTTEAFNQGTAYNYSVIIDCATRTLSQVYQYLKYYTRYGATGSSFKTYMVQRTAVATWAVNKIDGEQYIEAYEDLYAAANTFSPVKQSPFGTFAGGKLFGAKGVWLQNMATADVQNFQLIDSDGATRTPPNQISITVTNTLASDRVAVFATTSTAGSTTIWKDQFTSHATSNTTGATSFIITTDIPSDTPTSGSIRAVVVSDTTATRETRYAYTTWSGSTFSGISGTLGKTYGASDTAYVPYIDQEASGTSVSVTVIYASDRYVLARVRRYTSVAILPFETPGTVVSTGYSQSTIRTTDTIVQ